MWGMECVVGGTHREGENSLLVREREREILLSQNDPIQAASPARTINLLSTGTHFYIYFALYLYILYSFRESYGD